MLKKIKFALLATTLILSTLSPGFASEESSVETNAVSTEPLEVSMPIQGQSNPEKDRFLSEFERAIPLTQEVTSVKRSESLFSATANATSSSAINVDANHAELITSFASPIYGSMDTPSEQRWYALSTAVNMKFTVNVLMESTADFDLYLYKLNQEQMVLEYIGNSTNAKGVAEYLSRVDESGIYYFMINNYEGYGNFALTAYGSNHDMAMEINDSLATAYKLNNINTPLSGVIDNPGDVDWYKFDVSRYMDLKVDFTSPAGTNYNLYYSDGQSVFQFNLNNTLRLNATGTYYFIVVSADGSYANTTPYQLKCKAISDGHRTCLVRTSDWSAILERDSSGRLFVNGNLVDFTYDFHNTVSNSAGTINTYMVLYPGSSPGVAADDWFGFVDFTTNFFGSQSKNKVLVLTLTNIDKVKIDRYASGAYNDSAHYSTDYARIIIDPETGKILDLLDPNYYYDYGNQTYRTIQNYTNVH